MDKAKVIEKFNQAVGLELAGLLQYNQFSMVLMGADRKLWEDFFKDAADESLEHARKFAGRVVSLGGVPCAEPEPIQQTTDVHEMLMHSLQHERKALAIYSEALALVEDHPAYRTLVEDQIAAETEDVEELEKYLNQVAKTATGQQNKRQAKLA